MIATHTKEFTLPFVGREEELRFLLHEYDQMLHAQYRSIWIEAPAGMGKTTLVEEFLRHIQHGPLKPWIVHAHLRERSSNSLATFVEALGRTFQQVPEAQREKLLDGLTSFYQERAKKIVGGENIQSMDMEEAITTAGYILKQLSKYFPLIVIIEDIHVLKGEVSFYALRHLLAITEHVPLLSLFISRPTEEKTLLQFCDQIVNEGCKKYDVKSLKEEDVVKLVEMRHMRLTGKEIQELMRLSGGNALLLRELLRSGSLEDVTTKRSTTERIIHYLMKELERLPKKDRQVIAIAGMLGEEFSEQLLHEITQSKEIKCWSDDVLQRFEQKGIINRRKKILKAESEKKEILLRMGVFAHALWWEAARRLYQEGRTWTDRKFAEIIVPLLNNQGYPLLTDTELIVNLFKWEKREEGFFALIKYIDNFSVLQGRWQFHSNEEYAMVLAEASRVIKRIVRRNHRRIEKEEAWVMIHILNAEQFMATMHSALLDVWFDNNLLMQKIVKNYLQWGSEEIEFYMELLEGNVRERSYQFADYTDVKTMKRNVLSISKEVKKCNNIVLDRYYFDLPKLFSAYRDRFNKPSQAVRKMQKVIIDVDVFAASEDMLYKVAIIFSDMINIPAGQQEFKTNLNLLQRFKKNLENRPCPENLFTKIDAMEIGLLLRLGEIVAVKQRLKKIILLSTKVWRQSQRFQYMTLLFAYYAFCFERQESDQIFADVFSERYLWLDEDRRFKHLARSLFYLEEWKKIDVLWTRHKDKAISYEMPRVLLLFEVRLLMCLLLKNGRGREEALTMVKNFSKQHRLLKNAADKVLEKFEIFLSLGENNISLSKKNLDMFLATDPTPSPFDKAHYAQLFARIGVNNGHPPKEFSKYVRFSLQEFEKLKIPKRVVFTAEKFHEAGLLSGSEYKRIVKKYSAAISRDQSAPVAENDNNKKSEAVSNYQEAEREYGGIRLRSFGEMKAFAPDGRELISRRWGTRKHKPSVYKRIVLELVRGKYEGKTVSRAQLLVALFPEMRQGNLSDKKSKQYNRLLSMYLPQLRNGFLPYQILEKTEDGFSLHHSVAVDVLEVKNAISKAKTIKNHHAPSALWLLTKAQNTVNLGEFASGVHDRSFKAIRKEIREMMEECSRLFLSLSELYVTPS